MLDLSTKKGMLVKMLGEDRRLSEEETKEYVKALVVSNLEDLDTFRRNILSFYFHKMGADYSFKTVTEYVNEILKHGKEINSTIENLSVISKAVDDYFNNILGVSDMREFDVDRELQNEIFEVQSMIIAYIKNNKKLYDDMDLEMDLDPKNNKLVLWDDYEGTEDVSYQASTKLIAWLLLNIGSAKKERHDLFKLLTVCIDYDWNVLKFSTSADVEDTVTYYKLEE